MVSGLSGVTGVHVNQTVENPEVEAAAIPILCLEDKIVLEITSRILPVFAMVSTAVQVRKQICCCKPTL